MKPFLIPALLFFYLINIYSRPQLKIIGALLLSAAGDSLLMIDGPNFFIFGLGEYTHRYDKSKVKTKSGA